MTIRIMILMLAGWIFFAFARCSPPADPRPRCVQAWRMSDGAICKLREYRTAIILYKDCTPPAEYMNPSRVEETEVCE